MSRAALLTAIVVLLSACSATPRDTAFGSTLPTKDSVVQKLMAADVAARMATLYPPARIRLTLKHGTTDAFGTALVESLRKKGYALVEFIGPRSPGAPRKASQTNGDRQLSYVVDRPLDAAHVRVTVFIDTQSVSRLYQTNERGIAPAGHWVRKE